MNTKEYIESGVLELYVAGLLSTEEMHDVELKACQYAEIKTELQQLQNTFEVYAQKHAMVPPAEVKEKVFREIGALKKNKTTETIVRELPVSKNSFSKYLVAASVGLLIVFSVLAIYFSSRSAMYQNQVAQLTEQQMSTQNELSQLKESFGKNNEQLAMLADINTMRVMMKGTDKSPESMAMVYWNKQSNSVYIDVKELPAPPDDKQYQLWFIGANGPVSAGVFDMKMGEMQKMLDATGGVAFAVTLEQKGGSPTPTLDEMYVIGNVPS